MACRTSPQSFADFRLHQLTSTSNCSPLPMFGSWVGCLGKGKSAHTIRRNQTSDKTPAASANVADNKASKAETSVSRVCTCTRDPRFS